MVFLSTFLPTLRRLPSCGCLKKKMSWGLPQGEGTPFPPLYPFMHITESIFFLMNFILVLTLVIQINFPYVCIRLF